MIYWQLSTRLRAYRRLMVLNPGPNVTGLTAR